MLPVTRALVSRLSGGLYGGLSLLIRAGPVVAGSGQKLGTTSDPQRVETETAEDSDFDSEPEQRHQKPWGGSDMEGPSAAAESARPPPYVDVTGNSAVSKHVEVPSVIPQTASDFKRFLIRRNSEEEDAYQAERYVTGRVRRAAPFMLRKRSCRIGVKLDPRRMCSSYETIQISSPIILDLQ